MTPKDTFFRLSVFEQKSLDEISEIMGVSREQLSQWRKETRHKREHVRQARMIYNSKKHLRQWAFRDLEEFYDWYKKQPRKCFYCGTEEVKLHHLFTESHLNITCKQSATLQLERRDTHLAPYSPDNCVLTCCFCSNHKSGGLISERDHVEYFAQHIKHFINKKYDDAMKSRFKKTQAV